MALGVLAIAAMGVVPVLLQPVDTNQDAFWVIYIFPVQRLSEFVAGILRTSDA